METHTEECLRKDSTINKLHVVIRTLQSSISRYKNETRNLRKARDKAQEELQPTKDSLNNMTALHGKLLRKLKRKENT